MDRMASEPDPAMRLVGRATTLEEANRLAEEYEARGFDTRIVKRKRGSLAIYDVYAGKKPDIFMANPSL